MSNLHIKRFDIDGPVLIEPRRHGDARGWFCESWKQRDWAGAGLPDIDWVQDNKAFSASAGTLRGLHFQAPPHAQAKLVQVLKGRIFDAIVDIRRGSSTFGKSLSVELAEDDLSWFYVPAGFAHGYQTLEPDTLVTYKVSDEYAPASEGGLLWDDPDLGIAWPISDAAMIAERDKAWPTLCHLQSPFDRGLV